MALDPASLPDDVDALKRMIVGMARDALDAPTMIDKLRSEGACPSCAGPLRRMGEDVTESLDYVPGRQLVQHLAHSNCTTCAMKRNR